ncbi:MAG: DUF87 domain-containing protein [Candidatus Atabeyarchaeum deiterrae]
MLAVNVFILLIARLLTQLLGLEKASLYQQTLGITLTTSPIVVMSYIAYRLFEEKYIKKKSQCAAIVSLSIVVVSIVSACLSNSLTGLPSPSGTLVVLFNQFLLVSGFLALLGSVAMSFSRRNIKIDGECVDPATDLAVYRGKTLVLKGKDKNFALCILKLASRSTNSLEPLGKGLMIHTHEKRDFETTVGEIVNFSHMTSLWNNVPDFSVEFTVEKGLSSVEFFTLAISPDAEHAAEVAEEKAQKLRSIMQSRFNTKIEFLQGYQLWSVYRSILGRDSTFTGDARGRLLKIERIQGTDVRYVAVSALKGRANPDSTTGMPKNQVEQFISTFTRERFTASMTIHLEATKPPSIASESRLIEKAKTEPNMRLLLELDEKKREASEDRNAQLSGYWKISAYVAYRGETPEETKSMQEKGDACIEAIYSNPGVGIECEKLKGKHVAKHLTNLLFRQTIGFTTLNASSRVAATLILLPEQHVAGIPETSIPAFHVPSMEELEDGELIIGTVLDGENEICPMRIKLQDLKLHTVIFGETGFGKTRLIMKILENLSRYDIAWTLIEMKGEYKPLVKSVDNVVYLKPASKTAALKISLFDPEMEKPDVHAKKIFTILKETFSTLFTDQNRELSAQMERVFYEVLVTYITQKTSPDKRDQEHGEERDQPIRQRSSEDKTTRNWSGFNEWLESYAKRSGSASIPQINSTIQALLNRLYSFTRTPLSEVFNQDESNVNFNDLIKRRAIIDLSEIKTNGTGEDLRLISSIITKYVATAAQQRGIQDNLKHILIIDDALDIVPEILTKRTTAETSITEQMVLLLRATGQGVIISTQRPNISQNILANSATKIFLRTTVDGEKAAKWLNLNEEQTNYLKAMPKMEAIITTPKHSKAIRIRTCEINPPKVSNRDIITNNMVNYPIIYDAETAKPNPAEHNQSITAHDPETSILKSRAEEAYQAGDYKEALRTYIKAIEAMKDSKQQTKQLQNDKHELETESLSNNSPRSTFTYNQQQTSHTPNAYQPPTPSNPPMNTPPPTLREEQPEHQHVTRTNLSQRSLTPEETQLWHDVKQAFKHQHEIIDETILQRRLNIKTKEQLIKHIEPLIAKDLIGDVRAPDYQNPQATTRIYYQVTDHENRNILQEYITTTIHKDLRNKGINTMWIDQNMELLTTTTNNNQSQYVITVWTNNTMNPSTTTAKIGTIRQELQKEQIKGLIIITPWKKDATKLQRTLAFLNLRGITPLPFNENETNKLVNHITVGALLYT